VPFPKFSNRDSGKSLNKPINIKISDTLEIKSLKSTGFSVSNSFNLSIILLKIKMIISFL
jgi:hypothetical protein